jgi:diaminohydroxyphosphoribosylaminopyrimidine deaminase/5-amino-6-(5-phosphoribosylamino)uracil reductase
LGVLAQRGIGELHVEAGARLNGALLKSGLVDELVIYFAGAVVGDASRGMFAIPELASLADRVPLTITDLRQLGADHRILARVG